MLGRGVTERFELRALNFDREIGGNVCILKQKLKKLGFRYLEGNKIKIMEDHGSTESNGQAAFYEKR